MNRVSSTVIILLVPAMSLLARCRWGIILTNKLLGNVAQDLEL